MVDEENPWVQALEVINNALGEPPSASKHAIVGAQKSPAPLNAPIALSPLLTDDVEKDSSHVSKPSGHINEGASLHSSCPEGIIQPGFDCRASKGRSPSPLPALYESRSGAVARSPSPMYRHSSMPEMSDKRTRSPARDRSPDRGIPSHSERRASLKMLRFDMLQEAERRRNSNDSTESVDATGVRSSVGRSTASGRTSPRPGRNSISEISAPRSGRNSISGTSVFSSRRVTRSNSAASLPGLPVSSLSRAESASTLGEMQDGGSNRSTASGQDGGSRRGSMTRLQQGSKSEPASPRRKSWAKSRAARSPRREIQHGGRSEGVGQRSSEFTAKVPTSPDSQQTSETEEKCGYVNEIRVAELLQHTLAEGKNQILEDAARAASNVASGNEGILGERVDESDAFWAEVLDKQSVLLAHLAAENQSLKADSATRTRLQARPGCVSPRQALEEKRVRLGIDCASRTDRKSHSNGDGAIDDAEVALVSELQILVEVQQALLSALLAEPPKQELSHLGTVHHTVHDTSSPQPQQWCDIENAMTKQWNQPVHTSVLTHLEDALDSEVTCESLMSKALGSPNVVGEVLLNEHARLSLVAASWRLPAPLATLGVEQDRSHGLNENITREIDELRVALHELEDRRDQQVAWTHGLKAVAQVAPQHSPRMLGGRRDIVDVISVDNARVARQVGGGRFAPHK